ncbi:chromosome segregation protein [Oikeobacillus pervagus]|uniref:Chromosome partition protein Smc n=1 Tax=Oikeobacillus pervagus TaxID=1325931 RepID=A0AAJ1SYF5_9BACI|nr:chromosome segregation protein SMC [Oikeobacillus pervagus]MDQ0215095.1 chromosome segregation protein [Oikeobacillus pervagus]
MFLKRLDVVGFKSFAERVSIDFVPGVTAVVGPNGSGKSNITDAIRWVLGEQSAKSLRGAKMEDIIFAGSESRKAQNFAEVTLTLDNEDQYLPIDYNEISVTRRVFRSGESEFFMNKQSCRLKDIIDLFMDSGLSREAFSIIGQGKIEEILNSKPEERRTIFEEAAGVLKYKTRKKKAEYKLAETQENLNRVQDILYELESQVEPLKIQASIAKDYLEKKKDLERFEVACIVYEIEELHSKWEQLKQDLQLHEKQEIQVSSALQQKEAKLTELRDKLTALDESVSDLQNVLLTASEELEKLEGRREVLKERKKNATNNEEQLKMNLQEATGKLDQLLTQKHQLEREVIYYEAEVTKLKQLLQEKQTELKGFTENIEEMIELLKTDYIETLNKQVSVKNEISYCDQQISQLNSKLAKLRQENEKYVNERQQVYEKKQQLERKVQSVGEQLTEAVHQYRNGQRMLEALKLKYENQEKNLYQAYKILQQAKSRKEMLESMEEDYAGFFQGVKQVLKARNHPLQGIIGAVAELVQVPKGYETAIEIALGSGMQHIVVENEEFGRKAIAFLKQHQYGRATFLPMNVIKGKRFPSTQLNLLRGDERFIGIASDLVTYEEKYENIITNLLGNVVVVENLKAANEMAKLLAYRYRIITLDGDLVNPGGSMTGGASKRASSSLLARKGELEELKAKLVIMEERTAAVETQVKKLKEEIQTKEKEQEASRSKGETLRIEEQKWKANLREIELHFENMNERLSIYDMEKDEYENELKKLQERKEQLTESTLAIQKEIAQLDSEIQQLTEKRKSERTSKDILIAETSDIKAELAAKNEKFMSSRKQFERVEQEILETNQRKGRLQEDIEWLQSEMTESFEGEGKLEEQAKRKLFDKTETTKLISLRREERLHLQQTIEDEELDLKELKRQHKGMLEVVKDEEVKLNRMDVELENRLEHLRTEYVLSYEAAKQEYPLSLPIDEARKKVKLIKLAIDELGTVNLGAIDEYSRVEERYTFLLEQQTDLQEAKDTLFQVIDEMDTEMKKRFKETFDAICNHFESVFRALFGGGRAELKLTDASNLLKTGVDIVAQPPGKKLQNLGLLSGGERALTAIALLFSILKVRPVPFCVLDEVEAALDEANVHRFSEYLKQYGRKTQFIVITHRKGTMEEADVLYGVTMQESGVSKLVSVRLEETKEILQSNEKEVMV